MIQFEEGDDHIIEDESRLPFRLLRNLGHGHSGNVEEVQNTITGAAFARKTIAVRGKRAKLETERIFQNEVKIIRGLNKHHHIIRVFATYMAKREVGLILQPVASDGDLGRFLETIEDVRSANASDPRLEPLLQVVDRAFGCLAGGLTFMHQQRIRHKDIKPQNILVHQGSVIYTDFGYSLDSSHLSHSTTEGQPDSLTRRYSAPEVHEHGERNSSSDVFSLGCVYLELLAVKSNSPALLPDEATFSAEMDNIHHILCSSTPMTDTLSLCATITSMTLRDKKNRRKAADVMDIFIRSPKYCCDNCRVSERIGNDSAKSLLSIASPTSTQIPDVISQSVNSEDQAVAFSESTPTRPSSSLQIVRISTENPSDATTSGTTMPAPKWSDELGMLLKYEWSEKYQRMYRQQYVQSELFSKTNKVL
jgi:serine/threonine protein kinase